MTGDIIKSDQLIINDLLFIILDTRQVDGGSSCEDVNECSDNNGGCDDACINTPGSYSCSCSTGYMLLYDGKSCIDIDECLSIEDVCNGGDCRNTPGGFSCVCSGGLMMGPDASSCLDLDECVIEPDVSICPQIGLINSERDFIYWLNFKFMSRS